MRPETPLLCAYQPQWPLQAAAVMAELRTMFDGEPELAVEHIGSTAVPGLCAKPVIDLMLGLADLRLIDGLLPALARQGWRYRPEYEVELPGRRYFVRETAAGLPRLHLHVLETDSLLWRRHLGFRDALRQRPDWATRYAELKQQLAQQHADDKPAYQAGKSPFITACLVELGLGDQSLA